MKNGESEEELAIPLCCGIISSHADALAPVGKPWAVVVNVASETRTIATTFIISVYNKRV